MADRWFRLRLALQALILRAAARIVGGERRRHLERIASALDRVREAT